MHIIGFGKVVQRFLHLRGMLNNPPAIKVYTRRVQVGLETYRKVSFDMLENYRPAAQDITFLCCSADEQQILSLSGADSRLQVAKANLAIVSSLIDRGFFREGTVFVLTNPSEVIAEYLWQKTHNNQIFALGLSHDFRRYKSIFSKLGVHDEHISSFKLNGNHWDFPVAVVAEHSALHKELSQVFGTPHMNSLVHQLGIMLSEEIQKEFLGCRPPIESGAQALMDVSHAQSLYQSVLLSGPDAALNTFVAGSLQFQREGMSFEPSSGACVQDIVDKVRLRHKKVVAELIMSSPINHRGHC